MAVTVPRPSAGGFLSHIFGGGPKPPQPDGTNGTAAQSDPNAQVQGGDGVEAVKAPEKKKGPLQKFFGIFGGKKKKEPEKPPPEKGDSP